MSPFEVLTVSRKALNDDGGAGSFEFVLHCLAEVSGGHGVQRDLSQAVHADGCLELAGE